MIKFHWKADTVTSQTFWLYSYYLARDLTSYPEECRVGRVMLYSLH